MASSKQRIVSGTLGGRFLRGLPRGISGVRPSSSRVRSAMFDRLQSELHGRHVLDLFAGTGACAFEALSRGAESADLVDCQPRVVELLKQQVRDFALSSQCRVTRSDALRYLETAAGPTGADLVIIDPPYAELELWGPLLEALVASKAVADQALVICERASRSFSGEGLKPLCPAELELEAVKRHGDTTLEFMLLARN